MFTEPTSKYNHGADADLSSSKLDSPRPLQRVLQFYLRKISSAFECLLTATPKRMD